VIKEILTRHLVPGQKFIYGFADLQGLLGNEFEGYSSGISIARKLDDTIVDRLIEGPTMEYYDHYNAVNTELAEISSKVCYELERVNIKCLPVIPTVSTATINSLEYSTGLRYSLSHKMVATRAGLGWIGKTDLLVTKKFGPRVRLVSILLRDPVKPSGKPLNRSLCGTCTVCVEKCPAGAATGTLWDVSTDRDLFFDAHKCRDMCAKLAKKYLNTDIRICGICVSVCPIGKREKP
jgi:epoxyqueuosine reductase